MIASDCVWPGAKTELKGHDHNVTTMRLPLNPFIFPLSRPADIFEAHAANTLRYAQDRKRL